MTYEDAKEKLKQIRHWDLEITNKLAEIEYWREKTNSTGFYCNDEKVQSSNIFDKMQLADIYIDLELEIEELYQMRKGIIQLIQSLDDPMNYVLFQRYVLGKMFKEIASSRGHQINWALKSHKKGVEQMTVLLDNLVKQPI